MSAVLKIPPEDGHSYQPSPLFIEAAIEWRRQRGDAILMGHVATPRQPLEGSKGVGDAPSPKTIATRERIAARFPDAFSAGVRAGFQDPAGKYPPDFQTWAQERRDAWFAGFNLGHHTRKNSEGSR